MIKTLAEHSVDTSLLSGGVCIDVGCLGFEFSIAMKSYGCKVFAYDIQDLEPPDGIKFFRTAIGSENKLAKYVEHQDKQACHISEKGTVEIPCYSLNAIYDSLSKYGEVDVLKLDCEGSEYFILSDDNFKNKPKQISIEFHKHAFPELHEMYYTKCITNLLKYYVPAQHELTDQHCAGPNYWDSLFVRKDLV